ncbi:GntR family transcriptional regulator [Chitinophagaceae bacterium LB-8]|uniref:GntR family transcriptional regulator n=1 Tax=Paraflavisolibacter caeni TaxID=2982496 RepID=A0A9X2XTY9_9BACT|nr:GntR family transcriptional regulator [Paraflavisolibacter caeni]MCU7548805.1 GntR family transcriptional regulator [Paraflavisolibacter caeni]
MNKIPLLDHNDERPLHRQAEEKLRLLVKSPEYRKGQLFPKETDLAKRWGISRNTLRQAIDKLVNEGLLERKKRSGTRVTDKKISTNLSNWVSFTHEMEDKGIPFHNLLLKAEMKKATKLVEGFLDIKEDTQLVYLQRIRSTGKNPMVYFESWFHPRIGLTGNEDFEKPLYEMLDEEFHIVPLISREEIRAIAATQRIADILKIKKGEPVLERKRLVLDAGKRPIEYNVCYYRSDWFTYSIEIKREL